MAQERMRFNGQQRMREGLMCGKNSEGKLGKVDEVE